MSRSAARDNVHPNVEASRSALAVSAYTERLVGRRRRASAVTSRPFEIDQFLTSISTALRPAG